MYRVYLKDATHGGNPLIVAKTITDNPELAEREYRALVARTELDGQRCVAVLSWQNAQLAYHRFDRRSGDRDYWRDRLEEIEWPHA